MITRLPTNPGESSWLVTVLLFLTTLFLATRVLGQGVGGGAAAENPANPVAAPLATTQTLTTTLPNGDTQLVQTVIPIAGNVVIASTSTGTTAPTSTTGTTATTSSVAAAVPAASKSSTQTLTTTLPDGQTQLVQTVVPVAGAVAPAVPTSVAPVAAPAGTDAAAPVLGNGAGGAVFPAPQQGTIGLGTLTGTHVLGSVRTDVAKKGAGVVGAKPGSEGLLGVLAAVFGVVMVAA